MVWAKAHLKVFHKLPGSALGSEGQAHCKSLAQMVWARAHLEVLYKLPGSAPGSEG